MELHLFDISQDDMVETRNFLEIRLAKVDNVPGTRRSRHFVLLSSLQIGYKLCSEDELYMDIQDFNLLTILDASDIYHQCNM